MENKLQTEDIDKSLADQFSKAGLNPGQLSTISKSITALQRAGHHVIDWSQFGQPPFEKFIIETQLPVEKVAGIQNLFVNNTFKEVLILKRGIPPMPNFYNVKLTLQNV